jgi:hypothetical protein
MIFKMIDRDQPRSIKVVVSRRIELEWNCLHGIDIEALMNALRHW